MANNVYFGNSMLDKVSVNVNNGLQGIVLGARSTTKDGQQNVTAINCSAAQFPSGPNPDKGKFGMGGGTNLVTIQYDGLESSSFNYEVTISGLSGRDLYFYVFENTLVGQDDTGRSTGITIKALQ